MRKHTQIVQYMRKLNYTLTTEGVCNGIAYMAMQAMLLNDMQYFCACIENVLKDAENGPWSSIEAGSQEAIDILAFLDGVALNQYLGNKAELFEKNKGPLSQDAILSAALVASKGIEEAGGLCKVDGFCGVYDKDDLKGMLAALRKRVSLVHNAQLAMCIGSFHHKTSMTYDSALERWVFVDANHLPMDYTKDTIEITDFVMDAFSFETASKETILSIEMYTLRKKNQEIFEKIVEDWKTESAWLKANMPTPLKIALTDIGGNTWFHLATREGYLKEVKMLLETKLIDINQAGAHGVTALYLASKDTQLNIVEYLLEQGAEIDKTEDTGITTLYMASQDGQLEIVKALIEKGAIVDKPCQDGVTPLFVASQNNHLDVVECLLVKGKAEVDSINHYGNTALLIAAKYGYLSVVEILLANKAVVDKTNKNGVTALYIASQYGRFEVVKALLLNGANVHKVTNEGAAPLLIASQNGHLAVAAVLLAHGAVVDQASSIHGLTPLHRAAYAGELEVVKLLVDKKADIHSVDSDGETSLHIALQMGHLAVVKFLIQHKAALDRKNKEGETPLDIALQKGYGEEVKAYLAESQIISAETKQGVGCFFRKEAQSAPPLGQHLVKLQINKKGLF